MCVSAGVPFAAAERLHARIVETGRLLRAGVLTDEEAGERIDRCAGTVFMAARGSVQ
jgi:hypothetical protein